MAELYDGRVSIKFEEKGHKYLVTVDGKKTRPPSVTTITGIVDKSGPIQNWAIRNTIVACRELIQPGQSYPVQELDKIFEQARRSSWVKKQEAADVGTAVHKWIELYFHGQEPELPPEDPYLSCVNAFLAWVKQHHVVVLQNERPVYSLAHGVSGRLDAIGLVDGALTLIDYKTSNGIYPEMWLQTAAYQCFYTEETGDTLDQRAIIRLGKQDGKFYSLLIPKDNLEPDYRAFLGALALYLRVKEIEKISKKMTVITNKGDWLDELS